MEGKENNRDEREERTLGNLIWDELKRCLAYKVGLQRYVDRQRRTGRLVSIIIAAVAIMGALGDMINHLIPLLALSLVAIATTFRSEIISLIQPEDELNQLDGLYAFYNRHFVKIEQLWYEYHNDKTSHDELSNRLFQIKADESEKRSIYNRLVRKLSKNDQEEMNKMVDYYAKLYAPDEEN